jgi:hypothetical protein
LNQRPFSRQQRHVAVTAAARDHRAGTVGLNRTYGTLIR